MTGGGGDGAHIAAAMPWRSDNTRSSDSIGQTFTIVLIVTVWMFVLVWYMTWGLWLVPYRIIRRGQRKQKVDQLRPPRNDREAWGMQFPMTAYVAPRFETGDARYAWLNRIQAVGKGTLNEDLSVDYEWYEVR